MAHETRFPIQLRFSDIDSYGHVNNVTFLSLLETARVQLHNLPPAGAAGYDGEGSGTGGSLPSGAEGNAAGSASLRDLAGAGNYTLVGRQEIEYLTPLLYRPEPIHVGVRVTDIGRSSFELGYTVAEQDESTVYAVAATTMILASRETGRPVALPEAYRQSLEQYRGAEAAFRRRLRQSAGA
ncbi:thioesterase family protein [Arthrobacter crystallopoietes]|uniref:acyl-CoA thioesterase n=1 Tax=Crystallibacter crystallopoietes TaxID=37928 RepID=UPI003D24B742